MGLRFFLEVIGRLPQNPVTPQAMLSEPAVGPASCANPVEVHRDRQISHALPSPLRLRNNPRPATVHQERPPLGFRIELDRPVQ